MECSQRCNNNRARDWILEISILIVATLFLASCAPAGDTGESVAGSTPCGNATGFPTGRFVHTNHDVLDFEEDGTYRYYWGGDTTKEPTVQGNYGVSGEFFTEMTHDYGGSPKIPSTYTWTFDGENLTFHLWGEDVIAHRKSVYDGQTYLRTE